ncbi:hypothetical protein G6F50_015058 [Rhizopus delemar]|uniref:Uncharacterized protein n=1 Tax=Rhizopus delemar TaxID=936053 RepID=A0A9P6Y0D5_9FUNG|nr:hypothetical protein G6F50_015058 [Rhizopus delemar]
MAGGREAARPGGAEPSARAPALARKGVGRAGLSTGPYRAGGSAHRRPERRAEIAHGGRIAPVQRPGHSGDPRAVRRRHRGKTYCAGRGAGRHRQHLHAIGHAHGLGGIRDRAQGPAGRTGGRTGPWRLGGIHRNRGRQGVIHRFAAGAADTHRDRPRHAGQPRHGLASGPVRVGQRRGPDL